jgi:hypothetical protein
MEMMNANLVTCALPSCLAQFPAVDGKRYCSVRHGKKASRGRQRRGLEVTARLIDRPGVLCPTPFKRGYGAQQTAQYAANELGGDAEGVRPYRCVCGTLHVGHAPGTKRQPVW